VGHKGNRTGDGLPVDERLHPLRDLRKNFLIHAGSFGAGLGAGRGRCRANGST